MLSNLQRSGLRLFKTGSGFHYSTNSSFPGSKAKVDGWDLHYEQVGDGDHVVLLMPGALGSSRTDFLPQINGGLDTKLFTLVAWDPPGYGYSRPPERTFPSNYLFRDAILASKLMSQLGHTSYSAVGWSDGATTALHLAAEQPQRLLNLVVWGGGAYLTPKDLSFVHATRDVEKWSQRMRAPMEELYGPEHFKLLWEEYCDAWCRFGTTESSTLKGGEEGGPGDLCLGAIPKIKCPTLVIHGDLDPMIDPVHHVHLSKTIPSSKLIKFEKGKHNLHLRYAQEFNTLVTNFLTTNAK